MATEKRLIDAKEITVKLAGNASHILHHEDGDYAIGRARGIMDAVEIINKFPAVEVVHGHWEKSDIPHEKFCCSVCGGACWYYDYEGDVARSRYCPNCGAKMDGDGNG